jgi:hypothetical protein
MRFPEQTRKGSEAHRSALSRLADARNKQRRTSESHDQARQTSGEPAAATELSAANEQLAAREAWVLWIERGY